ncbi:type VI secretion system baseplate subunit TssK [Aurantivibrio plasticivorans]
MLKTNKIAWMESQYLFPHHFQQQERYIESVIEQRAAAIREFVWGFKRIQLDESLLSDKRIGVTEASGIMPDGCPFNLPQQALLPAPKEVGQQVKNELVYLILPIYQPGSKYIETNQASDNIARYRLQELEIFDYCSENINSETIESATLQFRIGLESEELGGFTALPFARIQEVTQEGAVILDKHYIPPVLSISANRQLSGYLNDTLGMLGQRGDALAQRFTASTQEGSAAAIADFMLLQLINGYQPRLKHLSQQQQLHPETLYRELVSLSGELATFTTKTKRPIDSSRYQHNDLVNSFKPIMTSLSKQLSVVLEQTAIPLPVEKRQYGVHVSRITDRSLLNNSRFILAVRAEMSTDQLSRYLPDHIKIGSVDTIRDLVNNQLTGITLSALPVAPREISYHAGFVYFELSSQSEQWQSLKNSAAFAFHIAGDLQDITLEFWAIRQ